MPFRQLPATDATRGAALAAAFQKSAAVQAADLLISPETLAALTALVPQWDRETAERADALGVQTASTSTLDAAAASLRMGVSHFFQVYQLGVARGVFSPSGRASYGLSVNEETVPALGSEADLLTSARRIVEGDPRRVANLAEPPMAMPTAAEVDAALQTYQSRLAAQTTAKDAFDGEQDDVNQLRPAADQLIKDIWDEVEFALRRLDPPSLRRRAREWGVFYALRPGEPEEPATQDPAPPAA